MMRVLITGGYGRVGKAVVERLVKSGFSVKVIGLVADAEMPGAEYAVCDITDYPSLRAAVRGCEAIVHLAAIGNPGLAPAQQIFHTNVQGTFNVFRAAEAEGIRRVVQASSINALGMMFGRQLAPILYLPIDEDHPCAGSDAYSFSKKIVEEIGEYYWRRSGISSVALRLPYVVSSVARAKGERCFFTARELCQRLLALPRPQQLAWFETNWAKFNALRAQGIYEDPALFQQARRADGEFFAEAYYAMTNRANLFAIIDDRDSAQAVELGLVTPYEGSHVLFVNDDHNQSGLPAMQLAALFYPDVDRFHGDLTGSDALICTNRARDLLGFKVEYSFNP
jgi:nucleoside-diphosphate-sugar epimerase